ncbi:MAG: M23 family metallopeptidase [Polynucleobacter sp.]
MSIYEPKGRRIKLEGTEISRGFKGQQVYDPSRSMLQESRERTAQYEKVLNQINQQSSQTLEALSDFSSTLDKFLVDRQKKINEEQKNLGIADIVNGTRKINPDLYETYKKQRNYLEKANDASIQTGQEIKQTDPGFAETFLQKDPAIKGWRAYGQALQLAQQAGGQLESFFDSFLKSDEAISYSNNEGKVESFTPRTAQTQEQLSAAWEVGMQKFIQSSGINQINPVIIAENLTPFATQARSELLGRRMREIIQVRENNERDSLQAQLATNASAMAKDPTQANTIFQTINKRFIDLRGGDKGAGNKDFHAAMEQTIRAKSTENRFEAEALFQTYRQAPVNPKEPGLGTWGSRFDMTDLNTFLQQTSRTQQAEADEEIKQEASGILEVFFASPNQSAYKEALKRLGQLPQTEDVRDATLKLTQNGPNYNPQREEYLVKNAKSKVDLDVMRAAGAISNEAYNRGTLRFAEEKQFDQFLPDRSSIKGAIRAVLTARTGGAATGVAPEDFNNRTALLTDDLSGRAIAYLTGGLRAGRIKPTPEDVNKALDTFLQNGVEAYYIKGKNNKYTYLSTPKDARFSKYVLSSVQTADGRTGQQILDAALANLPANLSSISQLRLTADRIQDTVDVLSAGGKPPSDVEFLAQRTGVSVPELIKRQAAYYPGLQVDMTAINNGNKVYLENKKINPVIAEQLRNPRLTDQQRAQYNADLRRQREQQELQTQPARELSSFRKQLSSVNYEGPGGQPGVDLFFEDKQFPVVLPGTVKDIGYESGYGNWVVIESTDPETGEAVDVLYAHLASRTQLKKGESVNAGQLVGRQGGTGNVRSADGTIASIDFLAPAPAGSKSMAPYRNYDRLRRRVVQSLGYR